MVMGRTILQMDEPEHRVQPGPRGTGLPLQDAREVGGGPRRRRGERADRRVRRPRAGPTWCGPSPSTSRAGDRPHPRAARVRLPEVPALGHGDHQRGCQLGPRGCRVGALRDYFADVLAERRARPGDDLISELVRVEVDGEKLSDEEIYSFLRLLAAGRRRDHLPGLGQPAVRSPAPTGDQFDALFADCSLYPQAFEESLRWEPPVTVILRRATRDTELAGVTHRRGRRRRPPARRGEPRRAQVRSTPTTSTCSARSASTSGSGSACTSAWGCTWPAWSRGWPSTRCSTASRTCTLDPEARGPPHRGDGVPLAPALPVAFSPC